MISHVFLISCVVYYAAVNCLLDQFNVSNGSERTMAFLCELRRWSGNDWGLNTLSNNASSEQRSIKTFHDQCFRHWATTPVIKCERRSTFDLKKKLSENYCNTRNKRLNQNIISNLIHYHKTLIEHLESSRPCSSSFCSGNKPS